MERREFLMLGGIVVAGACLTGALWPINARAEVPAPPVSPAPPRRWLSGSPHSGCARPLECADVHAGWERQRAIL